MRIATANTYDNALEQLYKRQSDLSQQQERISTGQRVIRPSDDPAAAAQAERVMTRLTRIDVDQRALEAQRAAIATAESALGEATGLVQGTRDLAISALNAGFTPRDRTTVANQMANLRDQLFALSNRTDSNGIALFGGLGSSGAPFADTTPGVSFQATAGQRSATTTALPGAMDGQAIWMDVPDGNGVFKVSLGVTNTGTAWTDAGSVVTPSAQTGDNYSLNFSVVNGVTTYDIVDTTTTTTVATAQPYVDGAPIQFDGLSVIVHGAPANGDTVAVAPSVQTNVFKVLDDAIARITNAPGDNKLTQTVTQALVEIDAALERLQSARSQAGDWLNRADTITNTQSARSLTLEADRSRAVDLDMAKGISDFNKFQTGYQAALQSYAQIQKLTLFNFIN
ncbi:MAG: flagellar hook-associated protein FlgL [Rhodoferax sp.]